MLCFLDKMLFFTNIYTIFAISKTKIIKINQMAKQAKAKAPTKKYKGISGFRKGWKYINDHQKEDVRSTVMSELGIETVSSFNRIKHFGVGRLRAKSDIAVIETALAKYGWQPSDIWDDIDKINEIKNK